MEVNVQLNYNISWRPKSVFILPNSLENRGLEQILLTTNYLLMEITNFQLFSMKIQGYIGDNSLLVTIPEVTSSYGDRMNCDTLLCLGNGPKNEKVWSQTIWG